MTTLALGSMLIGIILGSRFRVLVLPAVIIVGTLIIAGVAFTEGESAWRALVSMATFTCLLQFGYVCSVAFFSSFTRNHEAARPPPAERIAWK